MNNYQAEKLANTWLNDNGLDEKSFMVIELPYIQAQQVAFALMKHHADLLDEEQIDFVRSYLDGMKNKAKRKKLTKKVAYRVLNLGKQINRQIFKAYKRR